MIYSLWSSTAATKSVTFDSMLIKGAVLFGSCPTKLLVFDYVLTEGLYNCFALFLFLTKHIHANHYSANLPGNYVQNSYKQKQKVPWTQIIFGFKILIFLNLICGLEIFTENLHDFIIFDKEIYKFDHTKDVI